MQPEVDVQKVEITAVVETSTQLSTIKKSTEEEISENKVLISTSVKNDIREPDEESPIETRLITEHAETPHNIEDQKYEACQEPVEPRENEEEFIAMVGHKMENIEKKLKTLENETKIQETYR